jgi:hypothetical protein
MARIRQLNPQNYVASSNINAEFENLIRYLAASEYGNKTIGELIGTLFNDEGEFDGPIQMRLDSANGLQYRVGEYESDDEAWITIATLASLRGPSGSNVGTIEGPFFYNRQDYVATAGQTEFDYAMDLSTDDVLVFVNGLLQAKTGIYTLDDVNNLVTFSVGRSDGDKVTIWSVRASSVVNYRRSDLESAAGQAVFPFVHTPEERILVFRNGLLQREGGAYDYTASPDSDTVTFTSTLSAGDDVFIITVENQTVQNVGGLMLEDEFAEDGLIPWSKLSVADDQIPQTKVNGLAVGLATKAKITVSASAPVGPAVTDLWVDTSSTPNQLKFYDGTQWIATNPASTLPAFLAANAGQYLRVNGTGTALEFGAIDFSTLVPKTYMGAANGVASLDSSGKLPTNQLPTQWAINTMAYYNSGAVANATVIVARIYGCKMRFTGWSYKLAAGSCTIQLAVDGSGVGSTQAVGTGAGQANFGSVIEVDATATGRLIQIVITGAAAATGLEIGLATAIQIS